MYCMIKYSKMLDFRKLEGFEWDKGNLEHIKKHDVVYKECEEVLFSKPLVVFFDKKHSTTEERYKVMGMSKKGRKLSLVFTIRKNVIRVLTARDQSKKEKRSVNKYILGGESK